MAAELTRETGVSATLHQSSGGVFEVEVDGDLLFSKIKLGRFPEPGEIPGLIQGKSGTSADPGGRKADEEFQGKLRKFIDG